MPLKCSKCGAVIGGIDQVYTDDYGMAGDLCKICYTRKFIKCGKCEKEELRSYANRHWITLFISKDSTIKSVMVCRECYFNNKTKS